MPSHRSSICGLRKPWFDRLCVGSCVRSRYLLGHAHRKRPVWQRAGDHPLWRADATSDATSIVGKDFCLRSRRRVRCWAGPGAFKLRDDVIVPLICPTCQNVFRKVAPSTHAGGHRLLCMGLFSIFWLGAGRRAPSPDGLRGSLRHEMACVACRAVARGPSSPPSPKWASAWQPSLTSRAKAGGPGRTRTCNQTVMSGRL